MKSKDKDLIIKIDGKIKKYKCYKKVSKSGGSGAITLPHELVGKNLYVEYMEGKNDHKNKQKS